MKNHLRKKAKNDFDKYFLKLMNMVQLFLEKPWKISKKHRYIKLVAADARRMNQSQTIIQES